MPDAGYQVAAWTGACAATGHVVHCALSNIQSNQTSTVRFEPIPASSFSVSARADGGHGAVSCSPGTVTDGGASVCTAVPEAGYQVLDWSGSCAGAGAQAQCHLTNIRTNQMSTVSFVHLPTNEYHVSATVSGGNGQVSCSPATVAKGQASTCTATPNPGYRVASWSGDCASAGTSTQCYLPKIQKDQKATVSFVALPPNTYHVSAQVDGGGQGSVSCSPTEVPAGGASTCTAMPDAGYQVAHWDGACLLSGINPHCTLSNIRSDVSSRVSFTAQPAGIVNVSARVIGGNGTVSCTPARLSAGGSSTCTAVPASGYRVGAWSGACAFAGSNRRCVLTNVQGNQVSAVRFVTPEPIPALSAWGLILLTLLMPALGAARARRRG